MSTRSSAKTFFNKLPETERRNSGERNGTSEKQSFLRKLRSFRALN